jgi:hypothetical protein
VGTHHLGLLAAYGYVGDPELYFCPAQDRGTSPNTNWAGKWGQITDPSTSGHFGGQFWIVAGVSTHLLVKGPWTGADLWANAYSHRNLTLTTIAQKHKTTDVSPLLLSCRNSADLNTPREPEVDSLGVAYGSNARYGIPPSRELISHDLQGINGVFYDGSGRWIPETEVTWTAGDNNNCGHRMSTHYDLGGNLHNWARQRATVSAP